jgi:hypothetical protein
LLGTLEQGAGDEGFADFGIGTRQKISGFHFWAFKVMTS